MDRQISCIVFCILLPLSPLHASHPLSDSLMVPYRDSFPAHVPLDKFNSYLLYGSPFAYDRLLSPFQSDSFYLPRAGNYRFGIEAYRNYLDMPEQYPDLDTNMGVSDIHVILGSTREQLLFLQHHQKITRNVKGTLNYNSIVSPGFLLNCLAKFRRLAVALEFNSRFFSSSLNFKSSKIEADENGGIKPGQEVEGVSKSDFEQLQTFLSDDKRVLRKQIITFNNEFPLFHFNKQDTTINSKIKLHADGTWLKWGTTYSGTADTSFYNDVFIDSTTTKDTAGITYYMFKPAISWFFERQSMMIKARAGLDFMFLEQRIDSVSSEFDFYAPAFSLNFATKKVRLKAESNFVISDTVNDGDFSFAADFVYIPADQTFSEVKLNAGFSELAPEALSMFYSSNHFRWSNDFVKEKMVYLKASMSLFENIVKVYAGHYAMDNAVYYGTLAKPLQAMKSAKIIESGINIDVKIKKWRLIGEYRYSSASRHFIRLPQSGLYGRFSFRDRFFKKALLAEMGISICAYSSWTAYAFMPATGAFYLQPSLQAGGAPSFDVFVNADIGRATLTLMMQKINDGLFGGENYVAASYPSPPRTIKFALRWRLYN